MVSLYNRIVLISIENHKGSIDEYIFYLLAELRENVEAIVVICSNKVEKQCRLRLKQYADKIYEEKKGYDFEKWRVIFLELKKSGYLESFNELVVLNDSFYGPLFPFREVFTVMETKKIDFWGITSHSKMAIGDKIWPQFIQTYFIVFRKNVFYSAEFEEFIKNIPPMTTYESYGSTYEFVLTQTLEKKGFQWDVFSNTMDWEQSNETIYESFLIFSPYKLITEKRLPIVSKYVFLLPDAVTVSHHSGIEASRVLQYIKENTNYKTDYIYQNLVKLCNMNDLVMRLRLAYTLPLNQKCLSPNIIQEKKHEAAIIVFLYYEESFEDYISYLSENVIRNDVYILTTDAKRKKSIGRLITRYRFNHYIKIIVVPNKGREWAALVINCKKIVSKYKYFCFVHDKKSHEDEFFCVGESFKELLWKNMLGSPQYIDSIIEKFEEENQLGLLLPPIVRHGNYFYHHFDFWTVCFDKTVEIAEHVGVEINYLDAHHNPLSIGGVFWARTQALDLLFKAVFNREMFIKEPMPQDGTINHALERLLPYIAQQGGYYSAFVMTEEYASNEYCVSRGIINEMGSWIKKNFGDEFFNYEMLIEKMQQKP